MNRLGYIYIVGTIVFTVFGQLILKWRIARYGSLPEAGFQKLMFLVSVLLDPFVIMGLLSAVLASFFWIGAMTKFELSFAYPFMSLAFVLVLFLSVWLFNEPLTVNKLVGMLLIVSGIWVSSRAM